MTYQPVSEADVFLRPDIYVARAVHRHGLWAVLRVAVAAWWNRPRLPADLSPRLREDMGLPPAKGSVLWPVLSETPGVPLVVWRPGL
jgi:hypothetical protein